MQYVTPTRQRRDNFGLASVIEGLPIISGFAVAIETTCAFSGSVNTASFSKIHRKFPASSIAIADRS